MKILATLLIAILVAPSALLAVPQTAHAIGVPIESLGFNDFLMVAKETLSSIHTFTSAVANEALVFNAYVLQPLAFVLSGDILKKITAGVISFVIGQANGTGIPQFVQNLQGHLQRVGDAGALAFFVQFGRNSNSPFASAITSSLQRNYLYNTSSAGFFAANRSTLSIASPNINAFLSGDWSKGGMNAWFALTTQSNNNPYTLNQAAQAQLASVVGGAQAARVAELNWGRGFLSWCGPAKEGATAAALTEDSSGNVNLSNAGTAPGDACMNTDGTTGTINTPGSVIQETLERALGSTQAKLQSMGQLANEVSAILGNIGTVMNTVNSVTQILGGTDSGGLFGMGQTSGTNSTSRLVQYQNSSLLGVAPTQVYQNAATLPSSGSSMLTRVIQYEEAWNILRSAALSASTTVASLATYCIAQQSVAPSVNSDPSYLTNFMAASTAQANAAHTAITAVIQPVIDQADKAFADTAETRALLDKIQTELNSTDPLLQSAATVDLRKLETMTPSTIDVSEAQQDTQSYNSATAIPSGSLVVTGGTIVDRMSLVSTNATTLKSSVCTPVPPEPEEDTIFDLGSPG